MKRISIFASFLLMFSGAWSAEKPTTDKYDRSAMTIYLLDYDANKYHNKTLEEWKIVKMSEKFDDNELSTRILVCRDMITSSTTMDDKAKAVLAKIKKEKLANQVIAKWFDRQPDGTMGVRVIHERGMYNAKDQDVLTAGKSKRGIDQIKDMGMQLINKSYFHVVDFADIKSHTDLNMDPVKEQHGWTAVVNGYLFKIVFDDATMLDLFENMWIYEDDSPETAKAKKEKFDNYDFNVELVATVSAPAVLSMQYGPEHPLGKYLVQKSDDELFRELMQKGYDRTVFLLENKVPDLRVKVNVFDIQPIRAKIGKKEALKRDQRYFVYEYVYNENTKESEPVRKAVIRAKKVVDNRMVATGESPTSTFYQIHGKKVEPGLLMEQRNDRGIGIQPRLHIGEMGGYGFKLAWNPNPMLNIIPMNQVKVFGTLAFESKEYDLTSYGSLSTEYSFMRWSVGISKGWYFARAFNFEVSAAYGMEQATWENSDDQSINVALVDVGAELGLHLTHWLRGFAGFDMHLPMSNATDKDGNELVGSPAYSDIFENRGGLTINLGLSIEF
ncbi:MAG TPA: hypothetical protein PK990_08630 [Salinivirgaceae bacterium]|nr:hypothetical protein [Salinivirgaceae bacterium]